MKVKKCIETSGANDTQAKLVLEIASNPMGERTITSTSSSYHFNTGGASGTVSFKFTQSKTSGVAKAIYIKSITVYYSDYTNVTYEIDDLSQFSSFPERQMLKKPADVVVAIKQEELIKKYCVVNKKYSFLKNC